MCWQPKPYTNNRRYLVRIKTFYTGSATGLSSINNCNPNRTLKFGLAKTKCFLNEASPPDYTNSHAVWATKQGGGVA